VSNQYRPSTVLINHACTDHTYYEMGQRLSVVRFSGSDGSSDPCALSLHYINWNEEWIDGSPSFLPKTFLGPFNVIQRMPFKAGKGLGQKYKLLLMGDDQGTQRCRGIRYSPQSLTISAEPIRHAPD